MDTVVIHNAPQDFTAMDQADPVPTLVDCLRPSPLVSSPVTFVSLRDAALAVNRSEKTIRRLVAKGRIPNYQEDCPPYRLLVDLDALQSIMNASPLSVHAGAGAASNPVQPGQPVHPTPSVSNPVQPGQPVHPTPSVSNPVQPDPVSLPIAPSSPLTADPGCPPVPGTPSQAAPAPRLSDSAAAARLVEFLSDEVDRLRRELQEARNQTRAEMGEKETRIQTLVDQLMTARTDAGKWQQAEQFRSQLYRDFMDLQQKYVDVKVQLELLEHNPAPPPTRPTPPAEGGREVFTATTTTIEAEPVGPGSPAPTPAPERRTPWTTWALSAALIILALLGLLWGRYPGPL